MEKDVDTVDPSKTIHVGEFMLDHKGDRPEKKIELRRSEIYLTELMERVCDKMDDYVRAIMRDSGKLVVIPLIVDGMMNSIIGDAHIIQDGDLNKSLKFYCQNIVEEYDEGFTKHFGLRDADLSDKICWEYSKLCKDVYPAEYEEDIVAAERQKKRKNRKVAHWFIIV
ncbi:unnamed protein product [Nesidiocoris tenuis]|uniref:DUF3456 domain-containing protein n=1 Tax=Nesidiocoris tenuis TaxID=355587 RepID=A0A6H5FYS9_9HEMI|nr:unnamed protein product [Nesidiocoris tenuis]